LSDSGSTLSQTEAVEW